MSWTLGDWTKWFIDPASKTATEVEDAIRDLPWWDIVMFGGGAFLAAIYSARYLSQMALQDAAVQDDIELIKALAKR